MILLISKLSKILSRREIDQICRLKNTEWSFGLRSQKSWFKKNIKSNDLHNFLIIKNKIRGYTCLRKRTYKISKKINRYLLFDRLIIEKKLRQNYLGKLLMIFNNKIIKKNKLPSFLVCRPKTLEFYNNHNWRRLNKKYFEIIDSQFPGQYGMVYNITKTKKQKKLLIWTKK